MISGRMSTISVHEYLNPFLNSQKHGLSVFFGAYAKFSCNFLTKLHGNKKPIHLKLHQSIVGTKHRMCQAFLAYCNAHTIYAIVGECKKQKVQERTQQIKWNSCLHFNDAAQNNAGNLARNRHIYKAQTFHLDSVALTEI